MKRLKDGKKLESKLTKWDTDEYYAEFSDGTANIWAAPIEANEKMDMYMEIYEDEHYITTISNVGKTNRNLLAKEIPVEEGSKYTIKICHAGNSTGYYNVKVKQIEVSENNNQDGMEDDIKIKDISFKNGSYKVKEVKKGESVDLKVYLERSNSDKNISYTTDILVGDKTYEESITFRKGQNIKKFDFDNIIFTKSGEVKIQIKFYFGEDSVEVYSKEFIIQVENQEKKEIKKANAKLVNRRKQLSLRRNDREISDKDGLSFNDGNFIFYSDSPEPVTESALATKGAWLNKGTVKGNGHLYLWHHNVSGKNLDSCVMIYNPNKYDIRVNVKASGLTNDSKDIWKPDTKAWKEYLREQNKSSIKIGAGQFGHILDKRQIAKNHVFGTIANIEIVDLKGRASKAILYDFATVSKKEQKYTDNMDHFATAEVGIRPRGVGDSYIINMDFDTLVIDETAHNNNTKSDYVKFYSLGYDDDSFGGKDMIYVKDESGEASGKILGNFGQIMRIKLPIKNNTSKSGKFKICVGSTDADCLAVVKLGNNIETYNWISPKTKRNHYFAESIEIDNIPAGETRYVEFDAILGAMGTAPFAIVVTKAK